MEDIIGKLLQDFEEGKTNRRELIRNLAIAAAAASTVSSVPAAAAEAPFKAVAIHHISLTVPDYAKTRDFYASLFGMKVSDDDGKRCNLSSGSLFMVVRTGAVTVPVVDHFGIAIDNFNKNAVMAELTRRQLSPQTGTTELGISIKDPNGYRLQVEKPR